MHVIAALAVTVFLAFRPPMPVSASGAGSQSESEREEVRLNEEDKEIAFRRALESVEAMRIVSRQQPSNLAALKPKYNELRLSIARLCAPAGANQMPLVADPRAQLAGQAKVGAAKGPVTPSTSPSRPEDVEARRRATEEAFLTPGLIEHTAEPSPRLAHLSKDQMSAACTKLERDIGELDRTLKDSANRVEFEHALDQLRQHLVVLGATPKE